MERGRFIADPKSLVNLNLSTADLADPDVRSVVIRHEHPEFERALCEDISEVDLGHGPMNPRLHLTMHEIVANQLWNGDPPEVWETAVRLHHAGYERHEILHMLGQPMSDEIWAALHEDRPYDLARHLAALRALPGSWERARRSISEGKTRVGTQTSSQGRPRGTPPQPAPKIEKAPLCGAFHGAPERTRTSTDHSVHKALNLNRRM
jgi:hypothetical protein